MTPTQIVFFILGIFVGRLIIDLMKERQESICHNGLIL